MYGDMTRFWKDKQYEKFSTVDVKNILLKRGYKILETNDDFRYDLLVEKNDKQQKVEIKQDFSCYFTNNIGVEYETRDKPSGIMISKADLYIYKVYQNPRYLKKAKNEKVLKEVKIFSIDKLKLKHCIKYLLEIEKEYIEDKELTLTDFIEEDEDVNFNEFNIWEIEYQNKTYEVEVKFVNGGDRGSNSLNIIFKRKDFIENFMLEEFVNRNQTKQEREILKNFKQFISKKNSSYYGGV